ncbi:MAG: hypothetical protein KF878_28265 [Planctomycetes bacterium]|nr:hypothetical protein [Planctomycetota bacterium]
MGDESGALAHRRSSPTRCVQGARRGGANQAHEALGEARGAGARGEREAGTGEVGAAPAQPPGAAPGAADGVRPFAAAAAAHSRARRRAARLRRLLGAGGGARRTQRHDAAARLELLEPVVRALETGARAAEAPLLGCQLALAEALLAVGKPGQARTLAHKASALAHEARAPREMAQALLLAQEAHQALRDPAQARAACDEAPGARSRLAARRRPGPVGPRAGRGGSRRSR